MCMAVTTSRANAHFTKIRYLWHRAHQIRVYALRDVKYVYMVREPPAYLMCDGYTIDWSGRNYSLANKDALVCALCALAG